MVCDVRIDGVDHVVEDRLEGGVDGVYEFKSCWAGKPMFVRKDSPKGQERCLWYSENFYDWDISIGSNPDEDKVILFTGEGTGELHPDQAAAAMGDVWHLDRKLVAPGALTMRGDKDFADIGVTTSCVEGTVKTIETNTRGPEDGGEAAAALLAEQGSDDRGGGGGNGSLVVGILLGVAGCLAALAVGGLVAGCVVLARRRFVARPPQLPHGPPPPAAASAAAMGAAAPRGLLPFGRKAQRGGSAELRSEPLLGEGLEGGRMESMGGSDFDNAPPLLEAVQPPGLGAQHGVALV